MKLITVACVNLLLLAKAAKQYQATFSADNSGIVGTVTVDNGQVVVDLDLSGAETNGFGDVSFADCTTGGLSYHIHTNWDHSDNNDRIGGTECSGTYTKLHWDPWHACGPASGNMFCGDGNATASDPDCIDTDLYSPDYSTDPFSAEVGDWSAKYSKLEIDSENKLSRTSSSFYEVMPAELAGQSVVFHCNSGARAFCAPFLATTTDTAATIDDQETAGTVIAEFDGLGDDSMIKLSSDGTITVYIDAVEAAADISECSSFEYSIFEAPTGGLDDAAVGDDCAVLTEQYDPTAQCLPWSGNAYCDSGNLCAYSAYAYNCDVATDRYSCAPGDLSGKAGELITVTDVYSKTIDGPDTLIPPVNGLIGKVIAINCPYSVSSTPKFLACAPIEEYEDDDSASTISFIIAIIASFVALLY